LILSVSLPGFLKDVGDFVGGFTSLFKFDEPPVPNRLADGILDGATVAPLPVELFPVGDESSKRADVGVDGGDLGVSIDGIGSIGIGLVGCGADTGADVVPSTSNSNVSVRSKLLPVVKRT
jgi:hypothetical protein